MNIETKYSIGDKVWWAGCVSGQKHTTCPDCLGQKAWTCKTPAGEEFAVPCNTCEWGYEGSRGYLSNYCTDPSVQPMTIGSVEIRTHEERPEDRVRYMCKETGIGSGTLHSEERLFPSRDEAWAAALVFAAEMERDIAERNAENRSRAKKKSVRKPKAKP